MIPPPAGEKAHTVFLCSMPGMTPRRLADLLTLFGSPRAAVEGLRRKAAPPGVVENRDWLAMATSRDPEREYEKLLLSGLSVTVRGESGYPPRLGETADPPWALFHRGSLPPPDSPPVAVVGSRRATAYGLEVSRWLSREMALAGAVVVSGAATGIDSAAHLGCLQAGGFTAAVLGCGVDVPYPKSSSALIERIGSCGCVLSEYPPGTPPARWRFPARNRIIAGLCRVLVVVEASETSGAMLTVDAALADGRDVMAVPGPLGAWNSAGTNMLIKSGAQVVTSPDDVLRELGLDRAPVPRAGCGERAERGLAERKLARELARGPRRAEELAASCGLTAAEALSALTLLEVGGEVLRGHDGVYMLAPGR